jgi:predicted ATPase
VNTTYKFLHDRIQQAAYSLIEEKNRQSIHYKIGRLMLKSVPYRELEEKIFDIVYQLNQGKDCITDKNEIAELINLNIKAGKKAKTSAAFLPAYNHFMFAISLLKEDRWNNHYDICLDLYNHASETAYLSDDFETMKILSEEILSNSKNILDKVTIYEVLIKADISRNLLTTAIKTGLEILAQLGLKMPEKPSALLLLYSIIKVNLVLSRRKIEHLIDLPEMTDPIQLVIIRIASITGTAAYYVNPVLLALMTLNCLSISLRYGLTSLSAFVYAGFGLILCGILGNSEMGYQIGSICLKILERFNAKDQKAKTMVVFYLFINHWKNPLKSSFKPLLEAYQIGVDVGDFEYAAGALANYLSSVVYSDINLQEMENELCVYGDTIAKLNQGTHLFASIMVRQAVLNLLYESDLPWELTGKTFNREVNLAQFLESDNKTALALYYLHEIELKKLYNKFKAVYWPQLIKQFLSIIFPDSHGNKSGIDIPIVL